MTSVRPLFTKGLLALGVIALMGTDDCKKSGDTIASRIVLCLHPQATYDHYVLDGESKQGKDELTDGKIYYREKDDPTLQFVTLRVRNRERGKSSVARLEPSADTAPAGWDQKCRLLKWRPVEEFRPKEPEPRHAPSQSK